jgi:hypothetical protein
MNSNVSQVIDGAGPITGLFVLLLGVAVFFIWRSLNKQMKKVDATLPGGPEDTESIGTEPSNDDRAPNAAKTRGEDDSTDDE